MLDNVVIISTYIIVVLEVYYIKALPQGNPTYS